MGVSTDAMLMYGVPLHEDEDLTYDEDAADAPTSGPAYMRLVHRQHVELVSRRSEKSVGAGKDDRAVLRAKGPKKMAVSKDKVGVAIKALRSAQHPPRGMNEAQRIACAIAEAARTDEEHDRAHLAMRKAFPGMAADFPCECHACVKVLS